MIPLDTLTLPVKMMAREGLILGVLQPRESGADWLQGRGNHGGEKLVMSIPNVQGIYIGVLATITMDLLSTIVYKLRLIAPLPRRLIGRWFASVARGQVFVRDISQLAPGNREVTIALSVHYVIGIALALMYLLVSSILGLSPRSLSLALGFGLCTNVFPWFLMFPAMGYGWFGSHGPDGTRLFFSSLVSHCFYGVGLWLGASILH